MALTQAEIDQIVQQVVNILRSNSQGIDELRIVTVIDGVTSLPARIGTEMVSVPITLLSKQSLEAANAAYAAAQSCTDAKNEILSVSAVKHVVLTQAEYDALPTKLTNTFYYILE